MTAGLLDRLLELLARWLALQAVEQPYTGPVTFNFNQGKPNKETIYLRMRLRPKQSRAIVNIQAPLSRKGWRGFFNQEKRK